KAQSLAHSPALMRQWIDYGYASTGNRCQLEPLHTPSHVPVGSAQCVQIRCHNTGTQSWTLHPGNTAGTHIDFQLWEPDGSYLGEYRSGLIEATVTPGKHIDLLLPLPVLRQQGTYHLLLDMVDEQHCLFHQIGSEPLEFDIEAG